MNLIDETDRPKIRIVREAAVKTEQLNKRHRFDSKTSPRVLLNRLFVEGGKFTFIDKKRIKIY